ncbi:MAG: hypothetical protein GXP54_13740 [Deltaproteobacteria bacterium]|nr:hypothetical protein [Deltaproteobacteria bacterium]
MGMEKTGMQKTGMKEVQDTLVEALKKWQKIEVASVGSTYKVMEQTDNPVIGLVMEIIRRDSVTHHKVQEFIVSTMEERAPSLSPDEMVDAWDAIENHIAIEKQMVEYVREALDAIKGKHMVIQEYLLNYLLEDEKKHDMLLETLDKIKAGMYPYGS